MDLIQFDAPGVGRRLKRSSLTRGMLAWTPTKNGFIGTGLGGDHVIARTGAPLLVPTPNQGPAWQFATGQYFDGAATTKFPALAGGFSAAFWLRFAPTPVAYGMILTREAGGGTAFEISTDGTGGTARKPYFFASNLAPASTAVAADEWHLWHLSSDGSNLQWYLDGRVDWSSNSVNTLTAAGAWHINRRVSGTYASNHAIGHVFVWNRPTTSEDALQLFEHTRGAYQPRRIWVPVSAGGGGSHDATGAMSAQSATVSGSAAAVATYTSSGAPTAQAATVAGTANHVTTHASSGVLEAQAATVAGSATHVAVHGSTGVLEAQAATVSGSADHSAAGAFSATGALTAQVATVAGSAAHLTLHTATGALVADSATAAGSAVHYTLHTAAGDLVADAASISGSALHEGDGAEVAKPFTGAGRPRRTRPRVVVEIDGEDFIAESSEEAQAILDQAKEAAEEKAKVAIERATKARNRPTRKVMADARKALELPAISAPDLGGYAEEISRQIEDIYQSAIQTIEVAALLRKRELEEEDDEDILMLL